MQHIASKVLGAALVFGFPFLGWAQGPPITVQAESGTLGADFATLTEASVSYITSQTDFINTTNPGSDARVVTYSVTFPSAGSYALYARVRVGPGAGNDDSFFYGNGFGTHPSTDDNGWITANQLGSVGYTDADAVVGAGGNAMTGVWKWIKLSDFNGGEAPPAFTVPEGALTQTFQIGGREDGLDFDQFAFAPVGVYYTVANLDSGQAGTYYPPLGPNEPRLVEAERGDLILETDTPVFAIATEGDLQYVRVVEDFAATQAPGDSLHVITYEVNFPNAGTYDLYARIRVGAGNFNDDSFYYGNGFGAKSPTDENDWITVNGLGAAGYADATDVVAGGGSDGTDVWKWINLSEFAGQGETPITFTVTEEALVQTFQLGGRENGLDFDKLAFGPDTVYYTVANLDNGEAGSVTPPPPPFTPTGPPIAQGKSKFLGNVYSASQRPYFENYWNQITPENAGKWGSVERIRDNMNWTELDSAYALAKNNGFPFHFHVLIWGSQQPNWIDTLAPATQLEEIEEWMSLVAERYPDIEFVEVVNEPLHQPPNQPGNGRGNYLEALGGDGVTGWDWIINSFRMAREYFPNSQLMINDYSIINDGNATRRYLEIVRLLQEESLIDIIGVQGHAFSTTGPEATFKTNLDSLASTGLPLQVTELDIDGPTDAQQLAEYQRIFPVLWEHPAMMGITLWGWKPGQWRTAQGAFLAQENGAERPALVWLREYVSGLPTALDENQLMRASWRLYPNPSVAGQFTVMREGESPATLQILNTQGQLLQQQTLHRSLETVQHTLTPGLYFVRVSGAQGSTTRKLLVQ
ncbi:endo-1,4-beta-xylanase [Catalinimonas alkaloidigena]|nr:endo-1,4-beta-xylanase [Catalinimonas alkaloidigena]